MADFVQRAERQQPVETVADYELYCHYVAGLVGIGLNHMFALDNARLRGAYFDDLANEMGLFLQKTNITRDFWEDVVESRPPRVFWPRALYAPHAATVAALPRAGGMRALNAMVCDALRHVPRCIEYMAALDHDARVFRFCAVPQVMALATLVLCFDNAAVLRSVVKMRKGRTLVIMRELQTFDDMLRLMEVEAHTLRHRAPHAAHRDDAARAATLAADILHAITEHRAEAQ